MQISFPSVFFYMLDVRSAALLHQAQTIQKTKHANVGMFVNTKHTDVGTFIREMQPCYGQFTAAFMDGNGNNGKISCYSDLGGSHCNRNA